MSKLMRITFGSTVMGGTIIGLMTAGCSEEDLRETLKRQRWQETLEALDSENQGRVIDGDAVHQWLQNWGTDDELPPPGLA